MSVAVVQHTNYSSGASTSATGTLVFTTTPTQGNLLLVGMSYAGTKHPSAAPSGWTQLDDLEVSTNAWLTVYYHVVGASETNSYAFTTTGGDFLAVMGYEISGQASSAFINQHTAQTSTGTGTITTASVTPTVLNCLAIAFLAQNDGSSAQAYSDTISTGWTIDEHPYPTFHSGVGGSRNTLTSDTTTAINTTFTAISSNSVSDIILIAPPAAATPLTSTFSLLGVG